MSDHGIKVLEESTALAVPLTAGSSVQVVIGTAPINTLPDPSAVVNTPILANSAQEAMAALGFSDDFANYTLCQTMYLTSNLFPVRPVVYINVLDPATHNKTLAAVSAQVNDKQAVVKEKGILIDTNLTVKDSAGTNTLVKGTDYTVEFDDDGYLVVTLLPASTYYSETSLKVSGKQIDPTAVTASDVVGSYNSSTGVEKGCEVIRQVYPKLGVVPGLLLAPGYSKNATVGAALAAKAANLNGVFKAMALVDLDTALATKYTDCKTVKESSGFTSKFQYVLWPCDKLGDYIFAKSAVVGALTAYYDAQNDDVPSRSPSNEMLGVTGQCLADGTEVNLDMDQASTVNTYGVTTAVNVNGYRLWGNYTGAYPGSNDAKDIWFPVRRMFNWQGNNFILTYFSNVDDPMNRALIEFIVDSENIRCAAYAPDKWAGAKIEYRTDDNPTTDILAGKITFRQKIAPYTPTQEIVNILSYDTDLLATAIGGE